MVRPVNQNSPVPVGVGQTPFGPVPLPPVSLKSKNLRYITGKIPPRQIDDGGVEFAVGLRWNC